MYNEDDPLLTANDHNQTHQPLPPTTSFGLSTIACPGYHKISNDLRPIRAFQEDHSHQQLYNTILYSKSGVCVWQYASVDENNLWLTETVCNKDDPLACSWPMMKGTEVVNR